MVLGAIAAILYLSLVEASPTKPAFIISIGSRRTEITVSNLPELLTRPEESHSHKIRLTLISILLEDMEFFKQNVEIFRLLVPGCNGLIEVIKRLPATQANKLIIHIIQTPDELQRLIAAHLSQLIEVVAALPKDRKFIIKALLLDSIHNIRLI